MDCSMVAPKTCVLKVHIHCPECEKKVKKLLQKINGVHSIGIDAEQGKVTVSGIVDPYTLIMTLGKAGKKAELLSEQCSAMNSHHQNTQLTQPGPVQGIDRHMSVQLDQLHQLSQIKRLKQVELTHSKTVKLSFGDHKDDMSYKNDTYSTKGAAAPCDSGGGCSHAMNHIPHCCHEIDVTSSAGPSRAKSVQHGNCHGCGPPPAYMCTPPGPSPASNYFTPGPPRNAPAAYPCPSLFSDDNPNSCSLM